MLTDNSQRLHRIEAKLDAVIQHLNIVFDPNQAINKLRKKGDKIGAVKLHRSFFGSSLVDAKKSVEAME